MKTSFILVILLMVIPPVLKAQVAPVTVAGNVTSAVPGDASVPVDITVAGFTNIGQFTLTLKFDTLKIHFVSASTNPALTGMSVTYTPPSGNTQGKLVLSWTGASNTSLADNSVLAGLVFHYLSGTGLLNWSYTYGSVCSYKTYIGPLLTALPDNPKFHYYQDGGIADRSAPQISAPDLFDPVPGPLPIPLTVNNFVDIGGFTLYLEYNPSLVTYLNGFTKNPAFDSNFLVGDNPGFDGMKFIVIQWYGSSVSLGDDAVLCTLNFNYPAADCSSGQLIWYDNGPTCEYSDGSSDVLIDMPRQEYYTDGIVRPGLPATWTGNYSSTWNDPLNWDACGIPDQTRNVVIPDVAPLFFPVISGMVQCRSLSIQEGAAVTVSPGGVLITGE